MRLGEAGGFQLLNQPEDDWHESFACCIRLISIEGLRQTKVEKLEKLTFTECTNLVSLAGLLPH